MNLLFPVVPRGHLATILKVAGLGALVAGVYGAIHDQISYSISPEYFTKMKFYQFAYLDFGFPPRVFASEIGFMATWWVGLLGGWFLGRAGLADVPSPKRHRVTATAFGIVGGAAVLGGCLGLTWFRTDDSVSFGWAKELSAAGIENGRDFMAVAGLHNGGYCGAVVGLISAVVFVRSRRITP
jgi:hypothetical protein